MTVKATMRNVSYRKWRQTHLSPWIWKYNDTTFSKVVLKHLRTSFFKFSIFSSLNCFLFGFVETVTIISPILLMRTIRWYQKSHSSPLSMTNFSKTWNYSKCMNATKTTMKYLYLKSVFFPELKSYFTRICPGILSELKEITE